MGMKDTLQRGLVKAMLKLPEGIILKMAGGEPYTVRGRVLDVRAQLFKSQSEGAPPIADLPPHEVRANANQGMKLLDGPIRPMKRIDHRNIPGPERDIPVRIYTPNGLEGPAPVLCWYHQGGCVIGTLDWAETFCTEMAERAKCIVVNIDYRKAPEHKFPAAVDDAHAAYRWVCDHAEELGGDPARVAVGGDSAGGHLSAAITHIEKAALSESGGGDGKMPYAQLLVYPWVTVAEELPSRNDFAEAYPLNKEMMDYFKGHYLTGDEDEMDMRLSPLNAPDHTGLPRAIIATAGFDPLCDEGEAYAEKLKAAGVQVEFKCYESLPHSFTAMSGTLPAAREAIAEICGWLDTALHH